MSSHLLESCCRLTEKGHRWFRTGHPWVYRDDVASIEGDHGDAVRVAYGGRVLGSAFLSRASKIALRWIERSEAPRLPDLEFWGERVAAAAGRRARLTEKTSGYRAVHDVADGVPGLVADRLGPIVVLQTTIAGTERLLGAFGSLLKEVLGASAVVARNDASVRAMERLPLETRVLDGEVTPPVWVFEEGPLGRIEYPADPLHGQKTGAFHDQRENRWAAATWARGRLLDAFSYQGLFALHAARDVEEAVCVDTSAPALELCRLAAEKNGLAAIRTVQENVFGFLKASQARGDRYDTVVLDPPAFAKSKKDLSQAMRGYREVNRRAMNLLDDGGILITCSCSYNLSEEGFVEILRRAAADARTDFFVRERRGASSDHPVLLAHPESRYLKCYILEKSR